MNIYALSSGPGVSGIAVIRVSGIHTKKIILSLINGEICGKYGINGSMKMN